MSKKKPIHRYAGVGSRETPERILKLMEHIGWSQAKAGWVLRSGGALGADLAFQRGCNLGKGKKEIFRPENAVGKVWALNTVDVFHPEPGRLRDTARLLHARNAMVVLGATGNQPVAAMFCWTPNGQITGGTGQAIRIALHYEIPVINLALPVNEESAREWLKTAGQNKMEFAPQPA